MQPEITWMDAVRTVPQWEMAGVGGMVLQGQTPEPSEVPGAVRSTAEGEVVCLCFEVR